MPEPLILPPRYRPARPVELTVGGDRIAVAPDGRVELPARYAGTSARQIADALVAAGHLPAEPEQPVVGPHEPPAAPCPMCGGIGFVGARLAQPCRYCGTAGEVAGR